MDVLDSFYSISDLAAGMITFIATALCFHSSGLLIHRFVPTFDFPVKVVAQLVLLWSSVVLVAIAIGFVGFLTPFLLLAMVSAFWLGLRIVSRSFAGELNAADVVDASNLKTNELPSKTRLFQYGYEILVAIGFAQVIQMSILTLPQDWDTLAYHLPLVDSWVQTGSVLNQRCAFWYVPGNGELLAFWFGGLFTGDFWSQLCNVPVLILFAFSLYAVLTEFGVTESWRFIAICGTLACTPVLRQLASVENDLAVAALFIAALLFAIRVTRTNSKTHIADWVLFSCAVGLLGGIKYYALGYAAVAIVALGIVTALSNNRALKPSWALLAVTIGVATLTSPWYLRNWIMTGSPLYPKGMKLLGIPDAWESVRPDIASSCLLFGSTLETSSLLFFSWLTQGGLFSTTAILILFPVLLFDREWSLFGMYSILRRMRTESISQHEKIRMMVCFFLLGAFAIYLITPNVIETVLGSRNMLLLQYHSYRFGLAFSAIANLVFILFVSEATDASAGFAASNGRRRDVFPKLTIERVGFVVVIISLIWVLLPQYGMRRILHPTVANVWQHPSLDIPWIDWVLLTGTCLILIKLIGQARLRYRTLLVLFTAGFVIATVPLSLYWHSCFDDHYTALFQDQIANDIRLSGASASKICVCDYRDYRMIGSRREHLIYRPLFTQSIDTFQEYLKAGDFELVIVLGKDDHWTQEYSHCLEWMRTMPNEYKCFKSTGNYHFFVRVNPERLSSIGFPSTSQFRYSRMVEVLEGS
jgi:hypothetical protein